MSTRKPPRWTKAANHRGVLVFDLCKDLEQVKPSKSSKGTDHVEPQIEKLPAYRNDSNNNAAGVTRTTTPQHVNDMLSHLHGEGLSGEHIKADDRHANGDRTACDFSSELQERRWQKALLLVKTEDNLDIATQDTGHECESSPMSVDPTMIWLLKHDVYSKSKAMLKGNPNFQPVEFFWAITNIDLRTLSESNTVEQELENEFTAFLMTDTNDNTGHNTRKSCILYQTQRRIWAALLADWRILSPQIFGPRARPALQLLANINILLSDHDWARSWIGFLHSLTSNMLSSLIRDLFKAVRMLKHLNVHAGALGIDWLVCKYGIVDYRGKLQQEVERRSIQSKPSTSDRPSSAGNFDQRCTTHGNAASSQLPTEQRVLGESQSFGDPVNTGPQHLVLNRPVLPERSGGLLCAARGQNCESASASGNNHDDSCKHAETGQQYRSGAIDCLSEEAVLLLAGWCRLGQQGESNVWIKVFCILYALASVGIEPSEAVSGRC